MRKLTTQLKNRKNNGELNKEYIQTLKMHGKSCFTAFVIRRYANENKIQLPIKMLKIQNMDNMDNTKCWQHVCRATGILLHRWWECEMVQPLWKTVWQFLPKTNIVLPYDPAIALLNIYPIDLKTYVHRTFLYVCS